MELEKIIGFSIEAFFTLAAAAFGSMLFNVSSGFTLFLAICCFVGAVLNGINLISKITKEI